MPARILIIEDDYASRELAAYLLNASGYSASVAEDGDSGVRLALETSPDLVICDLQIPRLNGYQVLQRLRSDPAWRPVPIIAVTAFSMSGDREKALAAGFDEHLTKPITPDTFVGQIEAYLPPGRRVKRPPPA
jgi:two-component system cell cycle response regulator DivK